MIKDYFFNWCLDFIKDRLKDKVKLGKVKSNLSKYIDDCLKDNELCTVEEEFDFQGLCDYLKDSCLDEVKKYICSNGERRKRIREDIVAKAIEYSNAKMKVSVQRVEKITNNAIDIIYDFYRSESNNDLLLLIGETQELICETYEALRDQNEKLAEDVKAIVKDESKIRKIEEFDTISTYINTFIKQQKENVKNQTIFPWFNDSPKYREVFPKLFVFPTFKEGNNNVTLENLTSKSGENIAILGDAGAGKSTLLRYIFAFTEIPQCSCLYITAKDTKKENGILDVISLYSQKNNNCRYLIFIDGVDEAYHNDYSGFEFLITKIKTITNCKFWLGCRTDYYKKYYGENICFVNHNYEINPWSPEQTEKFIHEYAIIRKNPEINKFVDKLTDGNESVEKLKSNPFQLSLIVFLADIKEDKPVICMYDLYERFMQKWFDREQKRGTCSDENKIILNKLREAAKAIYNNSTILIDDTIKKNTAASDLLVINEIDIYNERYASAFYHRSLASFLLAQQTIEMLFGNDVEQVINVLSYKLKDDVTNFVGDKFSTLSQAEKARIKNNLHHFYKSIPDDEENLSVREQIIYYITRLDIDVSDFLVEVINSNPQHPIMRLTLAYGCALSENMIARDFALSYAKSISNETIDAITNRAWTVVYFDDINRDPYTYRDNEKCQWKNARMARIKRFTKEEPRVKDYRFRLFDIPLFYSFLNDRGWKDISDEEYRILANIDFPLNIFNYEEICFLNEQKAKLLFEYEKHLNNNQ